MESFSTTFVGNSVWYIQSLPEIMLRLLTSLRILTFEEKSDVLCDTWLQWIWWLLGMPYTREYTVVHLNWAMIILLLLATLLSAIIAINFALLMAWTIRQLLRTTIRAYNLFLQLIVESSTCVFRLLASKDDPGETVTGTVISGIAMCAPESIRPDSPLAIFSIPSCQVSIGTIDPTGAFSASGCGIRVRSEGSNRDFILVPDHVLSPVRANLALCGSQSASRLDPNNIKTSTGLLARIYHIIDTDMLAFQISEQEASTVGVTVASILRCVPDKGVRASVTGPDSKGSLGTLRPDPMAFGCLLYSGSTLPGTSGAAYVVASSVAGIHQGGGNYNYGYSLRLAYVTLLYRERAVQESSETFLTDQFINKKRKIKVDDTWGHSDEVRIQIAGEYHIISRDSLAKVLGGREARGELTYESALPKETPTTPAPSENLQQMVRSGASPSSIELAPELQYALRGIIAELVTPLRRRASGRRNGETRGDNTVGQVMARTPLTASNTTPPPTPATVLESAPPPS